MSGVNISVNRPARGWCADSVTGKRSEYGGTGLQLHLPNRYAAAFLYFNTKVKLEATRSAIPVDTAPIAPAHNKLLLAVRSVGFCGENRDLGGPSEHQAALHRTESSPWSHPCQGHALSCGFWSRAEKPLL